MSRVEPSIAPRTGTTESSKLHRRALGVPDLMFFIIAASAPLTAVAGGQAATYLVTGNRAVAFMFIPLGIVLALFTVGYAAMLRFRPRPRGRAPFRHRPRQQPHRCALGRLADAVRPGAHRRPRLRHRRRCSRCLRG